MENQKETWKDMPGYEGHYQVSDMGRVKSLDRLGRRCKLKGRLLLLSLSSNNYRVVALRLNGVNRMRGVHQLVAMAFLGHVPCRMKLVVNHIDFDKLNNNLNNLEIVTSRENSNLKHIKSSSKYVGVMWHKRDKTWYSSIRIKGKGIHLGSFDNEIDAHNAYQAKLKEITDAV